MASSQLNDTFDATSENQKDVHTPTSIKMDADGDLSMGDGNSTSTTGSMMEPKPTPALVKRKKFKDFFQSPSDSLLSPMSRTLTGKIPLLLKQNKQQPKPKRLNNDDSTSQKQ